MADRDDLVKTVDISIEQLLVPERILLFSICIQIADLAAMADLASPSQSSDVDRASLKGGEKKSCIVFGAVYVSWPQEPVDLQSVYRLRMFIVGVEEFQDPSQIIRLARRLTYRVDLIWIDVS